MAHSVNLNQVRLLVAEDQLNQAAEFLINLKIKSKFKDQAILIKAQIKDFEKKENQRTLNNDELVILKNRVRVSILNLIQNINEDLGFGGTYRKNFLERFFENIKGQVYLNKIVYFSSDFVNNLIDNYVQHTLIINQNGKEKFFRAVPFLLKKLMQSHGDSRSNYFLVLAESGMGKTCLMIKLFIKLHQKQFFKKDQLFIEFIPFGEIWGGLVDEKISRIISQGNEAKTILILDGFDEDPQAIEHYKDRFNEIFNLVIRFYKVLITCRTQFFLNETDENYSSDSIKIENSLVSGKINTYSIEKIYIKKFNESEIKTFITKKYNDRSLRKKAIKVVQDSSDLGSRPMALAFIDSIINENNQESRTYSYFFQYIEDLIDRWLTREAISIAARRDGDEIVAKTEDVGNYKNSLKKFIIDVLLKIHKNRKRGLYIEREEIVQIVQEYKEINLNEVVFRTRSLLTRNAFGKFKFSHKIIYEYLIAKELFDNSIPFESFNSEGVEYALDIYNDMCLYYYPAKFLANNTKLYSDSDLKKTLTSKIESFNSKYDNLKGLLNEDAYLSKLINIPVCITIIEMFSNPRWRAEILMYDLKMFNKTKFKIRLSLVEFIVNDKMINFPFAKYSIKPEQFKNILIKIAQFCYEKVKKSNKTIAFYIERGALIKILEKYKIKEAQFVNRDNWFVIQNFQGELQFRYQIVFEYLLLLILFEDKRFRDVFEIQPNLFYIKEFFESLKRKRELIPYLSSLKGKFNFKNNLDTINYESIDQITELFICGERKIQIAQFQLLNNLTTLSIYYSKIESFNDFSNIKNLRELSLVHCYVEDLNFLAHLKKLETLNLDGFEMWFNDDINKITNDVFYLKNSDAQNFNKITNIEGLKFTPKLILLTINILENIDLTPLLNLKNLESISIRTDVNIDFAILSNLANLKQVTIRGKGLKDLTFIKNLSKLEMLHIAESDIFSLVPLHKMYHVKDIVIHDNNRLNQDSVNELKRELANTTIKDAYDSSIIKLKRNNL